MDIPMKKTSIFKQLLLPMILIVCILALCLTGIIATIFVKSYKNQIYGRSQDKSQLVSDQIAMFLDGAYGITEELSVNPSILTMKTNIQTPILKNCVERNPYLELLYIQGINGMQTGRSSGELADRSTRWWFQQTVDRQQPFISKSYYSVNTGMPCASIFFPMYQENEFIGIFAADLKLDYLQSLIEEFSDTEHGEYSFVIDGEGVVVAHPDSTQIEELYNYKQMTKTISDKDDAGQPVLDAEGNIVTEEQAITVSEDYQQIIANVMAGNTGSGKITNEGENYIVNYSSIPLKGESDTWSVITLYKEKSAMTPVYRMITVATVVAIFIMISAVLMTALLAHKLTKPIISITALIQNASDGDFSVKAEESIKNEIGVLSKSFNKMTQKISIILRKNAMIAEEVVESAGHLKQVEKDMDKTRQAVQEILDGSKAQNLDVEEVLMQEELLGTKFDQLQEKSRLLLEHAQDTIASSEKGMESAANLQKQNEEASEGMTDTYRKIMALEEQSRKISGILNTINNIASQTELLALNASVEAARAGEHGKGFSVVAESIAKLAADSSQATDGIEKIITELCKEISNVVTNIESIRTGVNGQTKAAKQVQGTLLDFHTLAEQTKESVNSMEELVGTMHQCNRMAACAVERIQHISSNTAGLTQQVAESIQEQLKGTTKVAMCIENLSEVSQEMKQEMTKFKL